MNSKAPQFLVIITLSVLAYVLSLKIGVQTTSLSDLWNWISSSQIPTEITDTNFILSNIRYPRALSAFFVGASLGLSGLILQSLLRNPLAEPYTLGLSGGSSLGALAAILFQFTPQIFWLPTLSSLGCALAGLLVILFSQKQFQIQSRSLILFGLMLSLFLNALVVVGLSMIAPDKMQSVLYWLMGELGTSRDQMMRLLCGPIVVLLLYAFTKSRSLDALQLGDVTAHSMGFNPKNERAILLLICTFLVALSVSVTGLIGFVGLVSPHLARKIMKTSRHQILAPASCLFGALLLLLADTAGRLISENSNIPAGSISALIGAPLLIYLLWSHSHAQTE